MSPSLHSIRSSGEQQEARMEGDEYPEALFLLYLISAYTGFMDQFTNSNEETPIYLAMTPIPPVHLHTKEMLVISFWLGKIDWCGRMRATRGRSLPASTPLSALPAQHETCSSSP